MIKIAPVLLASALFALAACGGDDAASPDAATSAGITCDPFTNAGDPIAPATHAGAAPDMTGGTIADGTYALTAWDQYNGSSNGSEHQETFVFSGGMLKHIEGKQGSSPIVRAGTYTTSGTTLNMNLQCPQTITVPVQYTATATTFAFVAPDDSDRVQTYTKQ